MLLFLGERGGRVFKYLQFYQIKKIKQRGRVLSLAHEGAGSRGMHEHAWCWRKGHWPMHMKRAKHQFFSILNTSPFFSFQFFSSSFLSLTGTSSPIHSLGALFPLLQKLSSIKWPLHSPSFSSLFIFLGFHSSPPNKSRVWNLFVN